MVEPLTLTASVIANLAFQNFLELGAGELDKALSETKESDRGALDTIAKHLTDQNFIICCCLITLILVMIKQKLITLSIYDSEIFSL